MTAEKATKKMERVWFGGPARALTPLDPEEARNELTELAAVAKEAELPRLAKLLAGKGALQDFLGAAFNLSFFLRDCARRRPQMLDRLFEETTEQRLAAIADAIAKSPFAAEVTEAGLMSALRVLKTEAHFLIALSELAGEVETETTVRRLSDLADGCVT
ncbi:bifunctional [glutamine synthetase] adenylyltransferase/[glutamine synthetase]-adenylyl-L-tyrosine phosphorylase, partial [Rhizobiaceae sp. 2RAB30]